MRIYIAGKIGNHDLHVYTQKFEAAENHLRVIGYEPVNPCKINSYLFFPWEDYILNDIRHLLKCEAIYMLKDWTESKGARIEHFIALEAGMKVIYEQQGLSIG